MPTLASTVINTFTLLGTAAFIIIIGYLTVALAAKRLEQKKPIYAKLLTGVVFGLLAAYATFMAVMLPDGTIPNVRELAAMMAGLAAGPVGGLIAGVIGGAHRFSLGGLTAVPCSLATVLVGLISGVISVKVMAGKFAYAKAALAGFALESFALGLLFVFLPFDKAASVASLVYVPMVGATTIGLTLWSYFLKKIRKTS